MKVWATKWATTQGIIEVEAEECGSEFPGMIEVQPSGPGTLSYYLHGEGKDWHRTEQDAIECSLKMMDKKIESIKRQMKRIEMDQARMRNRRDQLRNQA